jgi:hypothetical protein
MITEALSYGLFVRPVAIKKCFLSLRTRTRQRVTINYRLRGHNESENDSEMLAIFAEKHKTWMPIT